MPASEIRGPLRRNPRNPRYFTDESGRAIYLTGSHTWSNLQDMGKPDPPPAFDFDYYLDFLEALNHNFIRLWAWDMLCTWNADETVRPFPWLARPGQARDGKPRFDLPSTTPSTSTACARGGPGAGAVSTCRSCLRELEHVRAESDAPRPSPLREGQQHQRH
jgi:hypothetical protein